MGVVHNPFLNETFHAVKGGGAYLNGKAIHTSNVQQLSAANIVTEFGYDRSEPG